MYADHLNIMGCTSGTCLRSCCSYRCAKDKYPPPSFLLHLPIFLFHRLPKTENYSRLFFFICRSFFSIGWKILNVIALGRPPRCSADIKKRSANIKKPQRRHYQSAAQTLQAQLNSQGVLDPKFPECKSNSATDEPATVLQFTILVDINFPYFMNLCLDNSVHFTERCFQFLASSSRTDSI